MTLALFIGNLLVAYGPMIAIAYIVLRRGIVVIMATMSAFFWLIGLSITSLFWLATPSMYSYAFIIPISVLVLELTRYAFFRIYILFRTKLLADIQENIGQLQGGASIEVSPRNQIAWANMIEMDAVLGIGIGMGLAHGLALYVGLLVDSIGPGSLSLYCNYSISYFFLQAVWASCAQICHVFFTIITYKRTFRITSLLFVVVAHYLLSLLSLFNGLAIGPNGVGGGGGTGRPVLGCLESMLLAVFFTLLIGIITAIMVFPRWVKEKFK